MSSGEVTYCRHHRVDAGWGRALACMRRPIPARQNPVYFPLNRIRIIRVHLPEQLVLLLVLVEASSLAG